MTLPLLDISNLQIEFKVHGGIVKAVRGLSLALNPGETLAIVGESGSGKSVSMQAILDLLPSPPASVRGGEIRYLGKDLLSMSAKEKRGIRGRDIAMIFQDPMASLNPTMPVGTQIEEVLKIHTSLSRSERKARVLEMLDLVRIPEAKERARQYPHQLSGGMRQRVMIAMALSANPKVLIADEPTTALDVTIQAQILALLADLKSRLNMATIIVTHDLGVVARNADRVIVMYAGEVVEEGGVLDVLNHPSHPYTLGLKRAVPEAKGERLAAIEGTPPDLFAPPAGCAYAPRCPYAMAVCEKLPPPVVAKRERKARCWLHHQDAPVWPDLTPLVERNP